MHLFVCVYMFVCECVCMCVRAHVYVPECVLSIHMQTLCVRTVWPHS